MLASGSSISRLRQTSPCRSRRIILRSLKNIINERYTCVSRHITDHSYFIGRSKLKQSWTKDKRLVANYLAGAINDIFYHIDAHIIFVALAPCIGEITQINICDQAAVALVIDRGRRVWGQCWIIIIDKCTTVLSPTADLCSLRRILSAVEKCSCETCASSTKYIRSPDEYSFWISPAVRNVTAVITFMR